MMNEQYKKMPKLGTFEQPAEVNAGVAMTATIDAPESSSEARDKSPKEETISGWETPGWSTVDRLAKLQSFR